MRRSPRPKPVAVIGKRPVPLALQHLHHRLLNESIQHRRNAEFPHASSVRLGDFHPPHRLRLIGPAQQLFPYGWPMLFEELRQFVDGHPIHARPSVPRFAASDSVPSADTLGASLLLSSVKANSSWFFCRLSLMSCAAYLPFPLTPCGDRSGLWHWRASYALC